MSDAAWLIHERVHSWQHQKGMWVRFRGMLNREYRYGDITKTSRTFLAYGIEQQTAIVADYFRVKHGKPPLEGEGTLLAYQRLIPFAAGPIS